MPRGRPRKPTATKKLEGTYRPHRENPAEPTPEVCRPDPPEDLSPAARAEWDRITPELEKVGVISKLDLLALAGYCSSFATWREAERKLAEEGHAIVSARGHLTTNPWVRIGARALDQGMALGRELGLSPASRPKTSSALAALPTGFPTGSAFKVRDRDAMPPPEWAVK